MFEYSYRRFSLKCGYLFVILSFLHGHGPVIGVDVFFLWQPVSCVSVMSGFWFSLLCLLLVSYVSSSCVLCCSTWSRFPTCCSCFFTCCAIWVEPWLLFYMVMSYLFVFGTHYSWSWFFFLMSKSRLIRCVLCDQCVFCWKTISSPVLLDAHSICLLSLCHQPWPQTLFSLLIVILLVHSLNPFSLITLLTFIPI